MFKHHYDVMVLYKYNLGVVYHSSMVYTSIYVLK